MNRTLLFSAAVLAPTLAWAGFASSSHRKESRGASYDVASALDGDGATAWVIDPEEENPGQWIEIDVPLGKVDKVSFLVGWSRDEQTWADYARLKKARIQIIDMDSGEPKVLYEQEATFEDIKTRQEVDLPDTKVGGEFQGGKVRIIVTEVYPGKDYANMALGEALIHMVEFDALTVKVASPPSSEAEGHDAALLTDDDKRTYWASKDEGVGATISMTGGRYSISAIGLTPGPKTHARPKVVEITQANVTQRFDVPDSSGPHWFPLPALVGYTGSAFGEVEVKFLELYEGTSSKAVALSEVDFKATGLDAF